MAPPKGRPRGTKDALSLEMKAGEVAASKELSLIVGAVQYGLFLDLDPPLTVPAFMKLRNVAMMRRFFGMSAEEMASRLAMPPEEMDTLLAHPHCGAVETALSEAAKRIGGLTSLDDVAKEAEVRAGKEMMLIALTAGTREKMKALGDLADRRSPKPGRNRGEGKQVGKVFAADTLELIKLGWELHQKGSAALGPGLDSDVVDVEPIDAGVLNVPKALPRGV
jgi:hypothetical protein